MQSFIIHSGATIKKRKTQILPHISYTYPYWAPGCPVGYVKPKKGMKNAAFSVKFSKEPKSDCHQRMTAGRSNLNETHAYLPPGL